MSGLSAVLRAKEARKLAEAAELQRLRAQVHKLQEARAALHRTITAPGRAETDIAMMMAEVQWRAAAAARLAALDTALAGAQRAAGQAERALARTFGETRGIEILLAREKTRRQVVRTRREEQEQSGLVPRVR